MRRPIPFLVGEAENSKSWQMLVQPAQTQQLTVMNSKKKRRHTDKNKLLANLSWRVDWPD